MSAKLLTIVETATAMRISRRTVERLMESGQLAWVQVGARRRITPAAIDRYIDEHTGIAS